MAAVVKRVSHCLTVSGNRYLNRATQCPGISQQISFNLGRMYLNMCNIGHLSYYHLESRSNIEHVITVCMNFVGFGCRTFVSPRLIGVEKFDYMCKEAQAR